MNGAQERRTVLYVFSSTYGDVGDTLGSLKSIGFFVSLPRADLPTRGALGLRCADVPSGTRTFLVLQCLPHG